MILKNLLLPETLKNKLMDFATVSGTNYFTLNKMSPGRKYVMLNKIEHQIKYDVQQFARECYAQFGLEIIEEPVYGNFLGFITAGGSVHEHRDPSPGGYDHVRLNFMVSRPEAGGVPIIDDRLLVVEENQCWLNLANRWAHRSTDVEGTIPRIVLSLGSLVLSENIRNFGPLV